MNVMHLNFTGILVIIFQERWVNYLDLNTLVKIVLLIWTIFITIGIWRSAENYKGSIIWIIATFLFLSYRIFSLRWWDYTIFCYSECDTCNSGVMPVFTTVTITENKQTVTADIININK